MNKVYFYTLAIELKNIYIKQLVQLKMKMIIIINYQNIEMLLFIYIYSFWGYRWLTLKYHMLNSGPTVHNNMHSMPHVKKCKSWL